MTSNAATERSPLWSQQSSTTRPGSSSLRSITNRSVLTDLDSPSALSRSLSKDEEALFLLHHDDHHHRGPASSRSTTLVTAVDDDDDDNQQKGLLPLDNYTAIDWLHDLVRDHARLHNHYLYVNAVSRTNIALRDRVILWWDAAQGWAVAFAIGILTALVAFFVDIGVAVLADWKKGYCADGHWWAWSARCTERHASGGAWTPWSTEPSVQYAIFVGLALGYALIAGGMTMLARFPLKGGDDDGESIHDGHDGNGNMDGAAETTAGKTMYMAAGSGIPEIKTILSGFVIPHFLDLPVLVVKAVAVTFAVPTGMCLGKEGPFVHLSTCVGHLVANQFPKYRHNGRKMREMLSVACSAGLSVAFGAPIGGVLFSYEEMSTYFPPPVLWKAFLCSLVAAATLNQLNPTGTGRLVLFETSYSVKYNSTHYLVFILLGVCGGLFGGIFCKANLKWSRFFRSYRVIQNHPVLEVALVAVLTTLLQYPNQLVRATGDHVVAELLVDCRHGPYAQRFYVCEQEALEDKTTYHAWLVSGTLIKLVLITITFGCKVPAGILMPALSAGALFGRMVGQAPFLFLAISPGIFATVGAAAFLAGVSRMTVSLAVIMFELTGEVNLIPPFMVAILTSKWVADAISEKGVYDLGQHLLGLPFLDTEYGLARVKKAGGGTVEDLLPSRRTVEDITVYLESDGKIERGVLWDKLAQLKARGVIDAGLVLVNDRGICHGYLPVSELEFALKRGDEADRTNNIDLLRGPFSEFVDRAPLTLPSKAPVEYAVEMFGKLGLRYLIIVQEDTARFLGVIVKKRLVRYLDELRDSENI